MIERKENFLIFFPNYPVQLEKEVDKSPGRRINRDAFRKIRSGFHLGN